MTWPATGGNLTFNPATGEITDCETTVTSAVIPDKIGGVAVTGIGDSAFRNCSSLTEVTIPSSVTRIGSYAFDSCYVLAGVTIPETVKEIGSGAFRTCRSLKNVEIPGPVPEIYNAVFANCTGLERVTLPESVTGIYDDAFRSCSSLISVNIPKNVTFISSNAFNGCRALSGVKIPDGVVRIERGAFSGCYSLKSVSIPGSVKTIGEEAFRYCNMTSLTLADGITSIGERAFSECDELTSLTLPDSITSVGQYAFEKCKGLTSAKLSIKLKRVEAYAFTGCTGLKRVTIPSGITAISEHAFYGCTSLTSVVIPDSVASVDIYAFQGCSSLTNAIISAKMRELKAGIFRDCSKLTTVTIPKSVTSIDMRAFEGTGLKTVYYSGTTEDWEKVFINGYNDPLKAADIRCVNGTVEGSAASAGDTTPESITVVISENTKAADSRSDDYRLSSSARAGEGVSMYMTGKDGACRIEQFRSVQSIEATKEGFAPVRRTQAQLKRHPEIHLEPVKAGVPTVTAVWLNGEDVRHFEGSVDLLGQDPVTLTADVLWDSEKGPGTVRLVQGGSSVTFDSSGTVTAVLKNQGFDVSKTIYIWAGYDSKHATQKPLQLKAGTVPNALNGFHLEWGDDLEFTIPETAPLVGGKKIKMDVYDELPVEVSIEDGKVYVAVGYQKDKEGEEDEDGHTRWSTQKYVESVKDLRNTLKDSGAALDHYSDIRREMKELQKRVMFEKKPAKQSFGVSLMGFAEGYLDGEGTPHWLDAGMIVGVSGGIDYSLPFTLGPVPMFFEAGLSGEFTAQLNLLVQEAAKSFTPAGVLEGTVTLYGGAGVGIKKVATVSGGLEGALEDHIEIDPSLAYYTRITAQLQGYVKESVLFFKGSEKWTLAEGVWEHPERASLQALAEEPLAALSEALSDSGSYALFSREEMTDRSVFTANDAVSLLSEETAGAQETPFAQNVYTQARPQLAAFSDGSLLAVWTGLDNTRAEYDRPRLYYALRENGVWSEPAPVDAEGVTAESDPSLTVVNDTAYLAWCRANGPMGAPDSLEEAAVKLDLFAGVFDRTQSQWAVSRLTADQQADFSPVTGGGNGGAAVVWLANSAGDLFGKTGTTSIYSSLYDEETGAWTPAVHHPYDHTGEISDLAVDVNGLEPFIAWTQKEADGTSSVYLDGTRQSDGSGVVIEEGTLYWYQDGRLYRDGLDTGVALDSDRFQIRNNTLLYTTGSGLYSTLTARYYSEADGRWSEPVALTDGTRSIDNFSAAAAGTALQVLMTSSEVAGTMDSAAQGNDPYGAADLVLLDETPFCDLSIGEPWYPKDTYAPNSTMEFWVEVTNNGTLPADYAVSVTDGSGTGSHITSQQSLLPGCTEDVAIAFPQGETPSSQLIFQVTPLNEGDARPGDNEKTLTLQYEDVAVEHIGNGVTEDGGLLVYADIVNRGSAAQTGITVSLYQDAVSETALQTVQVESLGAMCSRQVQFALQAPAGQSCYVIAVSHGETDMNTATDSDFTVFDPWEGALVELESVSGALVELSWLDTPPAGTLVVAAYDESRRLETLGTASLAGDEEKTRVTLQSAVPEGASLRAYVLAPNTASPLMRSANLR